MELYTINEDYINYLRKFSENVRYNKNESRPYVGIVLKINDHNYFAPLGSPKPKHIKMKEALDFIKIENGKTGVINLNNMIPVSKDYITNIRTNTLSNKKYATLLEDQLRWIERNKETIISKSLKLYTLITTKENTIFHKRSNNFKLLEEKAKEYEKELNLIEEAKDQEIPQEKPLEEVKDQEIPQEKPLEEVKDQEVLQEKPLEEVKDQEILQEKPLEEVKEQEILQEKPLEEVKEQEILQEKPLEEAPKDDPWKKKLENDKAKGLSLGR